MEMDMDGKDRNKEKEMEGVAGSREKNEVQPVPAQSVQHKKEQLIGTFNAKTRKPYLHEGQVCAVCAIMLIYIGNFAQKWNIL